MVDSLTGWAVGDSGTIIHTADGSNWTVQNSGIQSEIVDVFFLNRSKGWALTWSMANPFGTVILRTEDGGKNWTANNYPDENVFMRSVYFADSLMGWMGGFPGQLLRTTDGGTKWNPVEIDSGSFSNFPIINFTFFSPKYGFANGGHIDIAGVIWRTTNYGVNWSSTGVGPEPVRHIHIFDSLNVLGVGGDFEYGTGVVKSDDGGLNWDYTSLEIYGIASALSFRTATEGWAPLGIAQKFIYTTDAGESWTAIPTPDSTDIFDLAFTDSLHGYAIGSDGVILKYDTTMTSISKTEQKDIATFKLFQNYPNPFNPVTHIPFTISELSFVTMKLYDVLGREVATLLKETRPAGYHLIRFNSNELASGPYYYKLTAKSLTGDRIKFWTTRKMLIVK